MLTKTSYGIESELGRIVTYAHKIKGFNEDRIIYCTGSDFFERTASRERFKSIRFEELMLDLSTDVSVRRASHFLNRFRNESKGISPTTLRNTVKREGKAIQKNMEQKYT